MQECSAAVRLHVQFDRGLFLGLAAEDLGDDAFHFAAISLIEQARAPCDQGVAADD